jgi:hypothetical protein
MPIMINEGGKGAAKFSDKTHTKHIPHTEGAGELHDYPDTEPEIRKCQDNSTKKAKAHKTKEGYRY